MINKNRKKITMKQVMNTRFAALALVAAVAATLTGCAPLVTQSPNEGWRPVNVKSVDGAERLLLDGYDVVGMLTDKQARVGDPKIRSVYKSVTLYFSSAENKTKFDAKPLDYLPQYGGYCSNGMSFAIPWGGDGDTFRVENGKLYIFGGIDSKKAFELDVPGNIALADKYWKDEVEGSNAFFQRVKRTTYNKVPHYKNGAELAAAVTAAEKKGK